MAREMIERVTDDLDGSEGADSYTLSWNGVEYAIDLSSKNAEKLEKVLAPYLDVATKIGGRRKSSTSSKSGRSDLAAVRAWAAEEGYEVSNRGRVSQAIQDAYDQAH